MSFISVEFLVFCLLLFLGYFLAPRKQQWLVLLFANAVFYVSGGFFSVAFLAVTCVSAYICAVRVERVGETYREIRKNTCRTREEKQQNKAQCTKIQKRMMTACFVLNFGIWMVVKYVQLPIFPLGISFYTFMAMGYCIDVYRGKYPAEKNPARFALFLSFFPHMVQGPFSRYNNLKETLYEPHDFSWERLRRGGIRILWGIFKKTVVAYRFGMAAEAVFALQKPCGCVYVLVLMVSLALQLYADFSGYMDIAAGICQCLGIRLEENFRQPFFSKSIDEFWRRWHITLGAWFRDYVFYTVSVGKRTQNLARMCREKFGIGFSRMLPGYLALFLVWTATGLWHGTAWNFLLWGWMNLFFIAAGIFFAPVYQKCREFLHIREESRWWRLVQMVRTFLLFGYMEMVSGASSAREALRLTRLLFVWEAPEAVEPLPELTGLGACDVFVLLFGILLMAAVDIMKEKQTDCGALFCRIPTAVRYVCLVGLVYMILLLGDIGSDASKGFMYAQF